MASPHASLHHCVEVDAGMVIGAKIVAGAAGKALTDISVGADGYISSGNRRYGVEDGMCFDNGRVGGCCHAIA